MHETCSQPVTIVLMVSCMAQEKSRKRLPEEEGGDTQATYAYFAAEAAAKAQGKEPIGQVRLCIPLSVSAFAQPLSDVS